jgi:TENA/THI-4/PQQC family
MLPWESDREVDMSEVYATECGRFTGELWRPIEGIYTEILAHPFLQGLTDSTLSEESFRFYVLQRARVTLAVLYSACL